VRVRVDVLGCMFVRNAFSTVRWNLTQQAVSHLRTAIIANPQHGDAKYFLALQLMKSARGFTEAADLLSSIALSSPQEPRTVFDFSPVDVLLLAGQAHEKVGNLSEAAGSFHNAASWYATAAQEQWEVVCLPSSQIAPLPQAVALARALALSLCRRANAHISALRACVRACWCYEYTCTHTRTTLNSSSSAWRITTWPECWACKVCGRKRCKHHPHHHHHHHHAPSIHRHSLGWLLFAHLTLTWSVLSRTVSWMSIIAPPPVGR
jgi:hypothetical protein